MKSLLLFVLLGCTVLSAGAQAQTDELRAVQKVCNAYIDGGTNRDSTLFASAFSPVGNMFFMRNDSVITVPLAQFMRGIRPGEKLKRNTFIESINIFGDAAVAVIVIETDTIILRDIMQLLKTKEGWKIVNKIFNRKGK